MTLPDVLEALAARLPARVRVRPDPEPGWRMVLVLIERAWQTIYEITPTSYGSTEVMSDAMLEYALREECEARGWGISQKIWNDGSGITTVNVFVPGCPYLPSGKGDTPAEALARAVLSALEAQ